MESEVITVGNQDVAESIAKGLRQWFKADLDIREATDGWAVFVTGIVPENVRLLMNPYSLGVLDSKRGKV
jgi:hypothetical protein